MYKIDNSTAVTPMPAPGSAGPNPDGYFRYGTPVSQAWINAVMQEVCNVILADSLTLSKTDRTQLYTAIIDLIDGGIPSPGIPDVQADPDPHLGGDLDTNSFHIDNNGGSGVAGISANGTGYVEFNSDLFYIDQLIHRGDTNTLLDLSSMEATAGGSLIFDLTTSGIRLGGSNARIDEFLDEDNMASDSNTAISSQQAAKKYVDDLVAAYAANLTEILLCDFWLGNYASAGSQYGWRFVNVASADYNATTNQYTVQRSGTLSLLSAVGHWSSGLASVPTSVTVTLQVNNVDSALQAPLGRTTLSYTDSTNTVSVNAGDTLRFNIATNAAWTVNASSTLNVSLLFTP